MIYQSMSAFLYSILMNVVNTRPCIHRRCRTWEIHCRSPHLEPPQSATVEPLEDRRPVSGSLKCAALRQAYSKLLPETAVVINVDGDADARPDWLIMLVSEVCQPGVGAASGNRWFEPHGLGPVSFMRALWGVVCAAVCDELSIPWGGSLAVRREVVEASGWVELMKTSLSEDTALPGPLWAAGWKFVWVTGIVSVDDRPPGDLWPVARWLARQMLCSHLDHPLFRYTILPFSLAAVAVPTAALAGAAAAAAAGRPGLAQSLLAAYGATILLSGAMLTIAREIAAATILKPLDLQLPPRATLRWAVGSFVWVHFSQIVSGIGCLWCIFTSSVEWRGVHYGRTGHRHMHILRVDGEAPGDAKSAAAAVAAACKGAAVRAPLVPGAALIKCTKLA
jgi:hypothetical protein